MKKYRVLVLVGGIGKTSLNQRLFAEVCRLNKTELSFEAFDISTLPFYSQDIEQNYPASVVEFKKQIEQSDAVLIVTPEYNRSIPGVLKNALDLGSRPYGSNAWAKKPAAIMGASIGAIGTFGAQQHLRNICSMLNMQVMSQPEFYFNGSVSMTEQGVDPQSVGFIEAYLKAFQEWITVFKV